MMILNCICNCENSINIDEEVHDIVVFITYDVNIKIDGEVVSDTISLDDDAIVFEADDVKPQRFRRNRGQFI